MHDYKLDEPEYSPTREEVLDSIRDYVKGGEDVIRIIVDLYERGHDGPAIAFEYRLAEDAQDMVDQGLSVSTEEAYRVVEDVVANWEDDEPCGSRGMFGGLEWGPCPLPEGHDGPCQAEE